MNGTHPIWAPSSLFGWRFCFGVRQHMGEQWQSSPLIYLQGDKRTASRGSANWAISLAIANTRTSSCGNVSGYQIIIQMGAI
jgi:hypothetical protein